MGLLPALGNWARGHLWGEGNDPIPYRAPSLNPPHTHILPTHGFKHLLKLDTELLDVVHQDAGLEEWDGEGVSTNKYGWDSCPQPQDPPTLHWGT